MYMYLLNVYSGLLGSMNSGDIVLLQVKFSLCNFQAGHIAYVMLVLESSKFVTVTYNTLSCGTSNLTTPYHTAPPSLTGTSS